MRDRLRAHLELLRVFLTPTAVSDSLAGFIAAESLSPDPGRASPGQAAMVAGASVAAYWLGMVLNDLFDRSRDALVAPSKPIPSGRISVRRAMAIALALAVLALALAGAAGAGGLALALLGLILAYDSGGKNIPFLGNVLMGLCRSGNFLLGVAAARGQAVALSSPALLCGAAALCVFITLVTAVSRLEDEPFNLRKLRWTAAWTLAVPLGLYLARWNDALAALNAGLLAWLLLDALNAARAAGLGPASKFHGAAVFVRKALAGIFLVDAGVTLAILPGNASRAPVLALFLALSGLAWLWKREWLRRGSSGS